ncbi:MAG: hypothetical protein WBJ81_07170 [Rickettsiales bacterium]
MDAGELAKLLAKEKEIERLEKLLKEAALREAALRQKQEQLDHTASSPSKDEEKTPNTVRAKGIGKFFAGMIALALTPVLHVASIAPLAVSAACFVGSACAKGMSMISSSPETKAKWSERSQNLRSVGAKAFVAGALMATPFALGATLMAEGVYNGVTGEDKIGIVPTMRAAARVISGGLPQPGDPDHNPTKIWQKPTLQIPSKTHEVELSTLKKHGAPAPQNKNKNSQRGGSMTSRDSSISTDRTSTSNEKTASTPYRSYLERNSSRPSSSLPRNSPPHSSSMGRDSNL